MRCRSSARGGQRWHDRCRIRDTLLAVGDQQSTAAHRLRCEQDECCHSLDTDQSRGHRCEPGPPRRTGQASRSGVVAAGGCDERGDRR